MTQLRIGDADDKPEEFELVAGMMLYNFAQAGLIVTVLSKVLGSHVLFVSDNVRSDRLEGRREQVYRAAELKSIMAAGGATPRQLKLMHYTRDVFKGTVKS